MTLENVLFSLSLSFFFKYSKAGKCSSIEEGLGLGKGPGCQFTLGHTVV